MKDFATLAFPIGTENAGHRTQMAALHAGPMLDQLPALVFQEIELFISGLM
jgi:hypothetical protein